MALTACLGAQWFHTLGSAPGAREIRSAATARATGDKGLEVFWRASMVRIMVLAGYIALNRLHPERIIVSTELGVDSCAPFPVQ